MTHAIKSSWLFFTVQAWNSSLSTESSLSELVELHHRSASAVEPAWNEQSEESISWPWFLTAVVYSPRMLLKLLLHSEGQTNGHCRRLHTHMPVRPLQKCSHAQKTKAPHESLPQLYGTEWFASQTTSEHPMTPKLHNGALRVIKIRRDLIMVVQVQR